MATDTVAESEDIMKWNVITWKNGKGKNHIVKTREDASCFDVAEMFGYKYNGTEGEVLEIVPLED